MLPQNLDIVPPKPRRVVKSMVPDSDALLEVNTELEEELHQTQKLLRNQKQEFFAQELATYNLLIQALQADVKVPEFWAGCRALAWLSK